MLLGANVDDSHREDESETLSGIEDESETLSDIDDREVDMYLNNEKEKHIKKILWERANRVYLEEQAAKEAAAASNKKASTSETVAKSRKEMKQRQARKAKNIAPAQSSAEASGQTSNETMSLRSRVNYDRLSELFNKLEDVEQGPAHEF